ncbi:RNA-dependent RNA polymerase [Ceratobasidium sp. AG-Ba]|nr:RNA-dependent RNA polymerase [Ceratobasidium sp. AG-Ba]
MYECTKDELEVQFEGVFGTERKTTRMQLSWLTFDERHKHLVEYISRNIVVKLTKNEADDFRKLARTARLPELRSRIILIEPSNMFTPAKLLGLRQWIAGHGWEVAFQLEKIMRNMLLSPHEFHTIRPKIDTLTRTSRTEHVVAVLLDFISRLEIIDREEENQDLNKPTKPRATESSVAHVSGPLEIFLRVRFTDEENSQLRWDPDVDGPEFVKRRIGGILRNGFKVAGRKFEYLGYSSSALKTHTVWFVRPFDLPGKGIQNAETIIKALGDFSRDSQYPARMGARIAQAFSSTDLSITVEEVIQIPDIERNGSLFTDGVGTISPEVAKMMWRSLINLRKRRSYFTPAAYQVRLGGYKGMLAVDYSLEGSVICVRKSMDKFDSPALDVEVARAFDRPGPCFLNRPLIMVLETVNEIQADIFLKLQRDAVRETQESMYDFRGASNCSKGTSSGLELQHCYALGMKTVLKNAETDILRELKHRARIPVPESWKLVGIADEFDYLKQSEIYACTRDRDGEPIYLEGPYLITRSPVIHPGDVQVVTAIGRPPRGSPFDIEPLVNTVVLSCQGERSLASCLGGGDLDGDLYDLINLSVWPELAPRKLAEPAEYPPAPKK